MSLTSSSRDRSDRSDRKISFYEAPKKDSVAERFESCILSKRIAQIEKSHSMKH
ncbi:MAG: hypothetical protein QNJ74_28215 [Trichodesmium sp. MO_231.B1]|nr:hypothetical protein [Trichodesmium sp. MO_231.B1]